MPKVVLGQYAEANKKFRQLIEVGLILREKKRDELTTKARMSRATYYNRLRNPESMTVKELRIYRRELGISDEDLLSVL